jgi:hypothetical protein
MENPADRNAVLGTADAILAILPRRDPPITKDLVLEAIASFVGAPNWDTYSAKLPKGGPIVKSSCYFRDGMRARSNSGLNPPASPIRLVGGRRVVCTSAQNDTPAHPALIRSLQRFCAENGADLLISRFAYNSKGWPQPEKDSVLGDKVGDDVVCYDPAILPYVCDRPERLAGDLVFHGELNILPTAVDPIAGFDAYTDSSSVIIPHVMAVMKREPTRCLFTTGTVTMPNYLQRTGRQKALSRHVLGALFVQVDCNGQWSVRQICASDDGTFQDLETIYTPTDTRVANREAAHIQCIAAG